MANKIKFLVILVVSIIAVLSTQIAQALNYDQISQIAKDITVIMDGCNSGSGFIYQRQDNTYYVITAKHVFENSTVGCLAIAPDGERYDLDSKDITTPIPDVDLAVVSFNSDKSYEIASFGDSQQAASGKTVYVAGAPAPSAAIPQRTTLVVDGNIVGRQSSSQGYELIYNNATSPGMSGGAVLNTQGQIIGIHGQGDRFNQDKTGLNLAIPIETFINSDLGNLPQPLISANSLSTPEESEEAGEVNYTTLENHLKNLAWKDANDTTVKILLQLVGRENEGWFSEESLAQLPCNDLQFTDSLWQKYSKVEVPMVF
jgi:hypothetical protein